MTVSRRPPVLCATGTAPYRIAYSCVAGMGKCGGQGPILIPNANSLCQRLCPAVLQVHALISNVLGLHLPPLHTCVHTFHTFVVSTPLTWLRPQGSKREGMSRMSAAAVSLWLKGSLKPTHARALPRNEDSSQRMPSYKSGASGWVGGEGCQAMQNLVQALKGSHARALPRNKGLKPAHTVLRMTVG